MTKLKLSSQTLTRPGIRKTKPKIELFQSLPVCSAPVQHQFAALRDINKRRKDDFYSCYCMFLPTIGYFNDKVQQNGKNLRIRLTPFFVVLLHSLQLHLCCTLNPYCCKSTQPALYDGFLCLLLLKYAGKRLLRQ